MITDEIKSNLNNLEDDFKKDSILILTQIINIQLKISLFIILK